MFEDIKDKVNRGIALTKQEALFLLGIENTSEDFYKLLSCANELSRKQYNSRGYIFVQMGINSAPCSGNCKFCSLANDSFVVDTQFEKNLEQVVTEVEAINKESFDALFLMTTANYDKEKYIAVSKAVREKLSPDKQLVANIGDFDIAYAKRLKAVGFSGVYHVVRLREGIDTDIEKETRINTLEAIKNAGLELYYCIEPISREHTHDEIVDEMIRARDLNVNIMAVMGLVGVPGTPLEESAGLSELELTKIVAVTRLVTNPQKSMNIHEPMTMPLLAGVNQLYAEYGVNPRDTYSITDNNRGYNIQNVKKMLLDAEYRVS